MTFLAMPFSMLRQHAILISTALFAACVAILTLLLVESAAGAAMVEPLLMPGLSFVLIALPVLAGLALAQPGRRESEIREAVEALPIAYFITNHTGRLNYINPAAKTLFRGAETPVLALRQGTDNTEEQRQGLDRLQAQLRAGQPGRAVLRVLLPGAGMLWLDISATPLATRSRILWRVEDITTEHLRRLQIAGDRDRLANFIDQAPLGLYSIDETGRFRLVNPMLADWLGMTPEAMLAEGVRLQDFVKSDQPAARPPFDPFAPAEGLEVILQGRQGRTLSAAVSQTVLRQGGSLETRSALRDLAPERAWDDASRLSRQRFQRFFEIAPVGIALVDAEGRFKETNRALDDLLSDKRDRVVGHDLFEFVVEDLHGQVQTRLAAIAAGEQLARPLELRLKPPREQTLALFVSRLDAANGALAGLILYFIDLSEQKNLELQFAQSQKMQAVGQLAGGVAHDFNNLLTAMIGFCDLLLLRFRPGDQSFADIMQIKQNANRAANLVRQLLAFSRQQTLQPRVINISDVLAELSHLLNRLLGENVELKMIHGRDLGPVRVDQGQLEQVIINLAVNARDAMISGGTLTIRTSNVESKLPIRRDLETMPAGAYVLIDVTDDGCGIPRHIIGRIFEPFFSTKEVGSGTGLGLSTVYGIVKQTGGFIFVDSALGSGTKFSIYLPRHHEVAGERPAPAEAAEPQMPRDLTGVGTILLVEDEDPVRLFSARALRNKGYTVLEAKSGDAALKIIQDSVEPIHLVITDVVMPRMDGPTLIKHVRETLPDIAVIFISGYTEDTFRKRIGDDGGIHFLPKPFSLKQLASKVKEIIAVP